MGKPKKGRKARDEEELDDVAAELEAMSLEMNLGKNNDEDDSVQNGTNEPVKKKEKKKKKKAEVVEEEDEEDPDIAALAKAAGKGKAKTKPQKNMMSAFELLDMEESDEGSEADSEDEKKVEKNDNKKEADNVDSKVSNDNKAPQQKKGKKDKKKQHKQEEEDIDAILAALEEPSEKQEGKKSKKEKKKQQQEENENRESSVETEVKTEERSQINDSSEVTEQGSEDVKDVDKTEEEGGSKAKDVEEDEGKFHVKTAAEKKKEKKEREKKKKLQEKAKKQKSASEAPSETITAPEPEAAAADAEMKPESTPDEEHKADGEDAKEEGEEGEDGDKKKKRDRKKKKGEKEKEEKKKKPSAQVRAMQEQLKKMKEEEERLKREEEERIRQEEERIRLREEQKRLEEEKKQKKKQKEKERKERLKQEGKLLTEKQKQDRKRAQQMLEVMKQQGIEIPEAPDAKEKKKPRYERLRKKRPGQQEEEKEPDTPTSEAPESPTSETAADMQTEEETKADEEEEVEEEPKDAWDVSSEEEEEEEEKVDKNIKEETKSKKVSESKEEDEDEEEEDDEDEDEEDSEEESEEESSEEESDEDVDPKEKAWARILKFKEEAEAKRSVDYLRAPVVCVLGHVDTGKTKILDKLRRTNVQDGEAGGITQQIGATNVPGDAIQRATSMCKEFSKQEFKIPGLLIIDTPGHESFSNLRSRGSSLCDIAILVVDIMHGLEPQTLESINLLRDRKTPFVVALNKIDRLFQWKSNPNNDVQNTIKKQSKNTKDEFDERVQEVIVQFAEQSLNAALFYENKNPREYVSLVPTSAHTGDGMGNLLALICELTQTMLAKRISYSEELQATVMEVKAIQGLGTTIDVILVNGKLEEGQTVVVPGTDGPIVTQIRGLLMPPAMKELRVKNQYEKQKVVVAAQGVKLIAKDLEKTLAGLPLYVARYPDEIEIYKEELANALKDVLGSIKLSERGVFVQASTLGSLEALLEFLRTSKIPYAGINIGPIHKRDIMKASAMLDHDSQYAVVLAFDVKVDRDAQEMADSLGVKIFSADIIYHLFDQFMAYREELKKKKQDEFKHIAVFPCKLRILPQFVFNSRDPIVCGVQIEAGFIKEGTPLCVPSKEFLEVGRISSIEYNHKPVESARKGQEVCIKIENIPGETPKLFGRHFDETDLLVSKISREAIDAVKDYFRDEMTKTDWQLMVELKKVFGIL